MPVSIPLTERNDEQDSFPVARFGVKIASPAMYKEYQVIIREIEMLVDFHFTELGIHHGQVARLKILDLKWL